MWNTFSWMQLVGFVVLVAGTLVYNELIIIPGIEPDKGTRRALWIEGFLAAIQLVILVVVGLFVVSCTLVSVVRGFVQSLEELR